MVFGVRFRNGTLAHWVTHSVGFLGLQDRLLRGFCYPPHSTCSFGCVHKWALMLCM